jgi:hypothetical protein
MNDEEKVNFQVRRDVITKAQQLEEKYSGTNEIANAFAPLGLCSNCNNLSAFVTKYGTKIAKCAEFGIKLTENNAVSICTAFWDRSHTNIKDLVGMATLLDIKRKVGFGDSGDYF